MKLFYGRMLARNLDGIHGVTPERLQALVGRFPAVLDEIRSRRAKGEYGFMDLGAQDDTIASIVQFAEGAGQAYDHLIVLGIGGSSLGARALVGALRKPAWNELTDEEREFYPRITILENVDPTSIAAALGRIDPRRALVNVVSKSGGTAETLAQYLVVRGWLDDALGPEAAVRHLVFTTDPAVGPLRAMAQAEGIPTLDVPPAVGGRFSVLSPVGLLPAALVGIDVAGADPGRPAGAGTGPGARSPGQPCRALLGDALGGRHRAGGPDSRPDALFRPAPRPLGVVPPTLGREPGEKGRPQGEGGLPWPHPGGGSRGHRPAQPGPALHGRPPRQGRHLRPSAGPGTRHCHSCPPRGANGAGLSGGPHPGRAPAGRAEGNSCGAGPDGADALHHRVGAAGRRDGGRAA